ncbi:MAG: PAS domain S-box protein, partial [Bryobacterales bacterium]|nr:PAS domain S-box protein [Bryobacterales bacterium]
MATRKTKTQKVKELTASALLSNDRNGIGERKESKTMVLEGNFNALLDAFKICLEHLGTNVFLADRDLKLVYMNSRARTTLEGMQEVLDAQFGVRVEDLVGMSIDSFHGPRAKHIRRLLSDPKNLPAHKEIRLGPLTLDLTANPVFDPSGEYVGVIANWEDVTEKKKLVESLEDSERSMGSVIAALDRSQACIKFNMDGTVVTANENFCRVLGYRLDEIQGKHHSVFVDEAFHRSAEYRQFWEKLRNGEFVAGEFARVTKDGRTVYIQASYNPMIGKDGKPFMVVKYASDITTEKLRSFDHAGQIEAIGKAQAVIEFNMDGTILTANDNFLNTLGYSLREIHGRHHSMFVDDAYQRSPEYREFWAQLNRGEYVAGEFKRIGKGGKEIYIQASYNPILDPGGKPFKVVKYATNITEQKLKNADFAGQIDAISKSQAVIEFNMDGTIVTANDNFLGALGYTLREIQGRHHSMFVEESYARTPDYRDFWAQLNRGQYVSGEFKRIGKGGKEVFIQASYNPILDLNGKAYKVVKYATDVTVQVMVRNEITQTAQALASSSEELTAISQQMANTSEETATQANIVSAASEEVSKNVGVVATGSEEMLASIREISKSANDAARIARNA